MRNVAADPDYSDIVERLRNQLLQELVATHDPRMIDDGKFFETPPMAGPVTRPKQKRPKK